MRSGPAMPGGCSRMLLITLKIAALAPMPRASASMAVSVKAGLFASVRAAYRKSDHITPSCYKYGRACSPNSTILPRACKITALAVASRDYQDSPARPLGPLLGIQRHGFLSEQPVDDR